jgi:hypothetical protein
MRLMLIHRLVVLVIAALVLAGCEHAGDPEPARTGGSTRPSGSSDGSSTLKPPSPSRTAQPMPQGAPCPDKSWRKVPLIPGGFEATVALQGVTACTNDAGRLSLNNGALVPWVIEQPVLSKAAPSTDPQALLFREALSLQTLAGVAIEPGQQWFFSGDPSTLLLRVDSSISATWQMLTAVKNAADGKVKDGLAEIVSGRSPGRRAVVECARAAWDAGKDAPSAAQQFRQTPTLFVLDTVGLGQQAGACGRALQQIRSQPQQPVLVTPDDIAGQYRRPQVAGLLDETATRLPRLCASLPRC